jgi:hypothetical protein
MKGLGGRILRNELLAEKRETGYMRAVLPSSSGVGTTRPPMSCPDKL